jgi:hypothetical protein
VKTGIVLESHERDLDQPLIVVGRQHIKLEACVEFDRTLIVPGL